MTSGIVDNRVNKQGGGGGGGGGVGGVVHGQTVSNSMSHPESWMH